MTTKDFVRLSNINLLQVFLDDYILKEILKAQLGMNCFSFCHFISFKALNGLEKMHFYLSFTQCQQILYTLEHRILIYRIF